jgi:hypothetical protein
MKKPLNLENNLHVKKSQILSLLITHIYYKPPAFFYTSQTQNEFLLSIEFTTPTKEEKTKKKERQVTVAVPPVSVAWRE